MIRKIPLAESDIPTHWYNIAADMPNRPLPPLNPQTSEPLGPEALEPLFPKALIEQEVSTERWIEIPEPVREVYTQWRPTPMFRAHGLEKALDTPAHIYYKYEGGSPAGSHKPNTAVPQAWYNAQEGIKRITTETGAGQWGSALSYACALFDLTCEVYMVKVSFESKPYRKLLMNTWGADVFPSPSTRTAAGRAILEKDPDSPGSLGIAISEAVEMAAQSDDAHYALGSVLNHVLLHQTIVGQEAKKQMEIAGEYPDVIIAPFGGGSNFAGLTFPFLRDKIAGESNVRCLAVEPESCPKLTRGVFRYDYGDTAGMTPLLPMYTLGHDFVPAPIHSGGLRYHGAGVMVSQLLKDKLIDAMALHQTECFEAGLLFARNEGILPAPEATHGIAAALREAKAAKESGEPKVILFNMCGHGHFDLSAYESFLGGNLVDTELGQNAIDASLSSLNTPEIQPSP